MAKVILRRFFFFFTPILILILGFFYDKKYLKGRWFEEHYLGYIWAFKSIIHNNLLRLGKPMPWPTIYSCTVYDSNKIKFCVNDLNNFQSKGVYFQNYFGNISLGEGVYIAPNVGIITSNHDVKDLDKHTKSDDVFIGDKCWIGMNVVILPGVYLGKGTIVAAGAVVTKSFIEGDCIIGGSPAKLIKKLL